MGVCLVWYRDDLRVADNPALTAARATESPVVALFVLDEVTPGIRPLGAAARWWLHHSLQSLEEQLADLGISLVLRRGPAAEVVAEVVAQTGATSVQWNRRYGLAERETDAVIKASLREGGISATSHQATLLFEPWTVRTGEGRPYQVFTPFWRACLETPPRLPVSAPPPAAGWSPTGAAGDDLAAWALLPTGPDWAGGLRERWAPGAAAAQSRLGEFLDLGLVDAYAEGRDRPALPGTSHLSPHLRFGEVSPFQVWHAAESRRSRHAGPAPGVAAFRRELLWREFAYHTLFHHPDLARRNLRASFDAFPWRSAGDEELAAWRRGRTGVPLVDAGMRELWTTGYMHNRVRLVAASFLVKNLRVNWRIGEAWFWDTLVDADPASNPFNWQWVAGSGADAAPYFRILNPERQRERFDPDDEYVDRWVPERGSDAYPPPMVDLAASRRAALDAFHSLS